MCLKWLLLDFIIAIVDVYKTNYYIMLASDFIWPFLGPYMGVIPNPKMAFIFPISCILALIFPNVKEKVAS